MATAVGDVQWALATIDVSVWPDCPNVITNSMDRSETTSPTSSASSTTETGSAITGSTTGSATSGALSKTALAVAPFGAQIAGHGHGATAGTHRAFLKLLCKSDVLLKPLQPPPKGERELNFYQTINNKLGDKSSDKLGDVSAMHAGFRRVIPQFHGVVHLEGQGEYLLLEDLTHNMSEPSVMDVKVGARTWGPDASTAKQMQEDNKYTGTRSTLGFSVSGIIVHPILDEKDDKSSKTSSSTSATLARSTSCSPRLPPCSVPAPLSRSLSTCSSSSSVLRMDKQFGMALHASSVHELAELFFDHVRIGVRIDALVQIVLEQLQVLINLYESQTCFATFASSVLFAYDSAAVRQFLRDKDVQKLRKGVRVRLIDFAHAFPSHERDKNFLQGLYNLAQVFQNYLNADYCGDT